MACLCLGPSGSGKSLLLRRLQNTEVTENTPTVETVGTNIVPISRHPPPKNEKDKKRKSKEDRDRIGVREVGGCMAPLWASYYNSSIPILYVIDSSNLFQVSISTVLLMEMLTHEKLVGAKILILLSKTDVTTKKKLNYLKFMMRLDTVLNQAGKRVQLQEVSAVSGDGIEKVRTWIVETCGTELTN